VRDEERIGSLAAKELRPRLALVALDPRDRFLAERRERSFDPLPTTRTTPMSRLTCTVLAHELGDAQPARIKRLQHRAIAHALRVSRSGAARSCSTSASESDFGRERGSLGESRSAAGSSPRSPSRRANWKKRLRDETSRLVLRGLARFASILPREMALQLGGAGGKQVVRCVSSSQRANWVRSRR
jgi:hypothetical protein